MVGWVEPLSALLLKPFLRLEYSCFVKLEIWGGGLTIFIRPVRLLLGSIHYVTDRQLRKKDAEAVCPSRNRLTSTDRMSRLSRERTKVEIKPA